MGHSQAEEVTGAGVDTGMEYPKIVAVQPLADKRLLVSFDNGVQKTYDCKPLLAHTVFKPLRQDWLFQLVYVDSGGYGVIWSDEIDLSEAELWENGRILAPIAAGAMPVG